MKNRYIKLFGIVCFCACLSFTAQAQLNPSGAQYYVNEYIANPAMAGKVKGFKINGSYRALWNNIPGAPVSQHLTGDYGFEKVGVGVNLYNESAGLTRQLRAVGTYAYGIPISEESILRFGISLGIMSQRLDQAQVVGNTVDPQIGSYNARKTYFDGDFGAAYNYENFVLQAAVPNLKSFFRRDVIKLADETTFYSAVSYRFVFGEGMQTFVAEPKFAFRGIRGLNNLWDLGVQASIADQEIFFTGLYHSTQSATLGFGMDLNKKYLISALYTTQTSDLGSYTNGSFELNLRVHFGK